MRIPARWCQFSVSLSFPNLFFFSFHFPFPPFHSLVRSHISYLDIPKALNLKSNILLKSSLYNTWKDVFTCVTSSSSYFHFSNRYGCSVALLRHPFRLLSWPPDNSFALAFAPVSVIVSPRPPLLTLAGTGQASPSSLSLSLSAMITVIIVVTFIICYHFQIDWSTYTSIFLSVCFGSVSSIGRNLFTILFWHLFSYSPCTFVIIITIIIMMCPNVIVYLALSILLFCKFMNETNGLFRFFLSFDRLVFFSRGFLILSHILSCRHIHWSSKVIHLT